MTSRARSIGILHVLQPGHGTRRQCLAVHERGIELGHAVAIQDSAASGVEQRVVLEDTDRGAGGIEAGAAARQHRIAGIQGLLSAAR